MAGLWTDMVGKGNKEGFQTQRKITHSRSPCQAAQCRSEMVAARGGPSQAQKGTRQITAWKQADAYCVLSEKLPIITRSMEYEPNIPIKCESVKTYTGTKTAGRRKGGVGKQPGKVHL